MGAVAGRYARGEILGSILRARESGQGSRASDSARPRSPVDEFHIRGRQATIELAKLAALRSGQRVLDPGCGRGGSVRYHAALPPVVIAAGGTFALALLFPVAVIYIFSRVSGWNTLAEHYPARESPPVPRKWNGSGVFRHWSQAGQFHEDARAGSIRAGRCA